MGESFQRTAQMWHKKFGKRYAMPSAVSQSLTASPSTSKARVITKTTPYADGTLFDILFGLALAGISLP